MEATNCCECSKHVDISKNDMPPVWFGTYRGDKLIKVICATCISDPEKKKRWSAPLSDAKGAK